MRKLDDIKSDILTCQAQIAATYKNEPTKDTLIVREGFQKQLAKLNKELEEAQQLYNLEVINPKLVRA